MSEEKKETALVDTASIDSEINSLANQVMQEPNPDKAKQLIDLFNWNIAKKNTSRILKLNGLYDDVTDHMVERFRSKSDQFSNSDLLDYMKAVQTAIDTSTKNLTQMEEPKMVVQNNTQINVSVGETFDRESKERILAAIQATLKSAAQSKQEQSQVIEVQPEAVEIVDDTQESIAPSTTDNIETANDAIAELEAIVDENKENR